MGFTRDEFNRQLQKALARYSYSYSGDHIEINPGTGTVTIDIETESTRVLSPHVKFPVLPITMSFMDMDEENIDIFLKRFNASFQKGLG